MLAYLELKHINNTLYGLFVNKARKTYVPSQESQNKFFQPQVHGF